MALPTESSPLIPAEPATARPLPSAHDAASLAQKASSSSSASQSASLSASLDLGDTLRDVIIGFSDGLTVPFALTAGLSSLGNSRLVIMGGLAELFPGMISMGLGAYLAAVTERDRYRSALRREHDRSADDAEAGSPAAADDVCAILLDRYGVSPRVARPLADELAADPRRCLRFRADFALGMQEPHGHAAWLSGLTMGLSYLLGGLIPMVPYFLMPRVLDALVVSVAVTVVTLLAFGYAKNYLTIRNHRAGLWGALQTLVIGVLAAGTSYAIVKAIDAGASGP
ncbi:VIT family protein [Hirsutella rhossiliensis]|uniref:VIT family domain-containing protein n=1 Tax=Hirsutella rhossiliensis TaxID=111463 RepID=A0A9P8MZW8_9HYPO|nr:VIT family domain-containing protein [Hirsutella rhossiliensis]KAH0962187.1 VIT family domain-containing protein [Hirsutella rhossiliensis]